jgi:S-adenosylmethionine-diacylglycerol 3-amino-3-carboxypropyl transferase
MNHNHLEEVSFEYIRYANCWEDADVLLEALDIQHHHEILSIAAAGDNLLAILAKNPAKVVGVDVSAVQLYLCELKVTAMRRLNYQEFVSFLGFAESTERLSTFDSLAPHLSLACREYWNEQQEAIQNGVIHYGKFEQYFQLFKNKVLPTVHDRITVEELLRPKSADEQKEYYDKKWNTAAWRQMYGEFFGVKMMGDHGRDPAFLKHVKGSVPNIILNREKQHLSSTAAFDNYFLHYILNNTFEQYALPYYARLENFEAIKKNLDKLELRQGLIQDVVKEHEQFDGFNLSDIFEYMSDEIFSQQINFFSSIARQNARLVYWNLMIPRKMSEKSTGFLLNKTLMSELKQRDKGYFYGDLIIEGKKQ